LLLSFSAAIGQPWNGTYTTWDETTATWLFSHGKVFVYTRSSDGTWIDEPQVLGTNNKADRDYFGDSISISGDQMLVGASEQGPSGSCCDRRGKVYAFVKLGDEWVQDGEPLQPDYETTYHGFHFGAYVALDGDTALIGHECALWGNLWDEVTQQPIRVDQIVHVFTRSADGWVQMLKLEPSDLGLDPQDVTGFGRGVELQGDRALIWSDWSTAVMLENWQYVETVRIPGYSDPGCQRCGRIALSSDAIFFGGRPYLNTGESWADKSGSVFVVDNHSVLPVSPWAIFDLNTSFVVFFPHLRRFSFECSSVETTLQLVSFSSALLLMALFLTLELILVMAESLTFCFCSQIATRKS
jgi:hypothetical protein